MGKIFYIMGKSSSGKDTIYKHLIEDKEFNFKNIVGYTTRPIRQGEINGKEYYFVTVEGMEELIKAGKVIERRAYDTVHGVWNYFTADDGQIDIDKEDCLLIGTLESYGNVRKYFGEEFVNRIDKVIYFNDLDSKAIRKIVEANLEKRGLPFSTKTVDKIISLSEYEKFGARKVEKIIDEEYSLNKVKQ